ncbi:MAG: efflux transporter periplasmic adaptor subunit [Bacteroidetes bacterium]|jgi:membrane fusion protein, multidrug efflux system|nr:efflux transporter periplasmic adaptor subunit [Bacteroidota bacterium]
MKRATFTLALGICFVLTACHSKKEEKDVSVVYPITSPLKKDTLITTEYVAQIQSGKNIEVRAQEKGFLEKIYVDEGQYVKAGQVLFKIMPQVYQADVMKATAEVEQAKIDYQNSSTLAQNDIVAQNEKAMAKAKLDAAKADLRSAQLHLSFTTIKAPFSGVINRIPLKQGSLVNEGDLLTSLSDNTSFYAYFNLSETEYLNYQAQAAERSNKDVNLVLANGDKFPEKGVVQNIEGEFNNETGNIALRAKFANPNQLLRNGQSGTIQMNIPVKGALIIPQKASFEIQDQRYVFVVDKNGKVSSRAIQVAYEIPDVYILRSGLSEGDKFLLEGVQKVKDDDKVKTKFEAPEQVLHSLKLTAN